MTPVEPKQKIINIKIGEWCKYTQLSITNTIFSYNTQTTK